MKLIFSFQLIKAFFAVRHKSQSYFKATTSEFLINCNSHTLILCNVGKVVTDNAEHVLLQRKQNKASNGKANGK